MIVYRRFRGWRRRLAIGGTVVVGLTALVLVGLFVVYPRVGRSTVRDKVVPRLAAKLGRAVTVGTVDVTLGHATLRDVVVAGRGPTPLVVIDRVEVTFDVWASLTGTAKVSEVTLDGVHAKGRRNADGSDDVRDVLARLTDDQVSAGGRTGGSFGRMRPDRVRVRGITVEAIDEQGGATLTVGDGEASIDKGQPAHATLRQIVVSTTSGLRGELATLGLERASGALPTVTVGGGAGELWTGMALTGIAGTITPSQGGARYDLDLTGGYGGVQGTLWTARGHVMPKAGSGVIDLVATKFALDRLAPILRGTPVIEPERASVDADFHLELSPTMASFRGGFHVAGLSVTHWRIADKPVRGLDFGGDIAGELDRTQKKVTLTRGDFVTNKVPFMVTGMVQIPGGLRELRFRLGTLRGGPATDADASADADADADGDELDADATPATATTAAAVATAARLDVRLVVPPVDCQAALGMIPKEAAPYMAGYTLSGTYQANIHLAIDWANLDGLVLEGIDSRLGLGGCKVLQAPADSPLRLRGEFEHYVEVERGVWQSIWVGNSNPDYVSIGQVSPYLLRSLQTTEDSSFYSHHGFIVREFRTALVSNLRAGKFRHGASSISMQLVKNALLYREKTLARKLQELFLTWHMEQVLSKDRILEIYVNIIEYGPGIYGIGEAAEHYFGKAAFDLNPVEAAFFSSILPNPKERYAQFCSGVLRKLTVGKIGRIVDIMHKRGRLTDDEWMLAKNTPLVFARDGVDEADCMGRRGQTMRNARSTAPVKP